MLYLFRKIKLDKTQILEKKNFKTLLAIFGNDKKHLFLVGGVIRNLILHREIIDIDIAVRLPVRRLEKILKRAVQLCPKELELDTSGRKFGSYKFYIREELFELTSFRKEIYKLNNRFPKISFTKSLKDDANRRDFTINAIYMDTNGKIHTPIRDSKKDIFKQRLTFIGNTTQSITNDPLRILRFFRFLAEYKELSANKNDLKEIAANYRNTRALIKSISRNKLQEELTKMEQGENCKTSANLMKKCRIKL